MKNLSLLCAAVAVALSTLIATMAGAQSFTVSNEKKQVFLVSVYADRLIGPGVGGQYCPAKGQVVKQCASFLGNKGFNPIWSGASWKRNNRTRKYTIVMANAKLKSAPGRYYFMLLSLSNGTKIEPGNTTFFADLSPGTVVVFNRGNISMATAIAYAKEQLSQEIGEKMLALRYVPGGAVAVSCAGSDENRACRIGKQIALNRVSMTEN
jgi:hypothetical protein